MAEEKKELKAKKVSLIVKIVAVAFVIICAVLKWVGVFQNCEIKEICFIGGTIGAIFGDISINTALDKFKKEEGE
jgi:hypothetical protein